MALLYLALFLGLLSAVAAEPKSECIRQAAFNRFNETKHTSQDSADGVLDTIFKCLGTTDKYYVEFGTQDGAETNSRYFREQLGWTGLLMDGGFDNPAINLHQERLYEENICELFEKYKAPKPVFDMLSVDIDMNTFWVFVELFRCGYRPRVVITEVNNNFLPSQSYAAPYVPNVDWNGNCLYGASAKAFTRAARFFNYTPVHMVAPGHNLIFIADSEFGQDQLRWGLRDVSTPYDYWSIHNPCPDSVFLEVPPNAGAAEPGALAVNYMEKDWKKSLKEVKMAHEYGAPLARTFHWDHRKPLEYYDRLYGPFMGGVQHFKSRRALVPANGAAAAAAAAAAAGR